MDFYSMLLAKSLVGAVGSSVAIPVPVNQGGTGATTVIGALTNLGAAQTTRTINSKALSSDITLSATDVSAASTSDVGSVSNLRTTAKTVVGAINELYNMIGSILNEVTITKFSLSMGTFAGTGNASRNITLSYSPRLVFVFRRNVPFTSYDSTNNYIICSSAAATSSGGATAGITLSENTFTLTHGETNHSQLGTYFLDLNRKNYQYMYITFREISE